MIVTGGCGMVGRSAATTVLAGDVGIFTRTGFAMLSRWTHFLSGVTWIGILYYFNVVQVPAFAEFEAGPRTEAVRKLVPRALWWFRWGAALTLLSGLLLLALQEYIPGKSQFSPDYMKTAPGISISTGILMGLIMFLNVWLVIWPNQKIVIASAERVAGGGEADPNAAAAGRKGLLASRTNTIFSIALLFFMGATSHFAGLFDTTDNRLVYWLITIVVVALIELNALGLLGGTGPGPTRKPLETHKAAIISGLVLTVFFIVIWQVLFSA
jgi:uncharacterized membrane protein